MLARSFHQPLTRLPALFLAVDILRTYAVEHESVTISAGNHVQLRKS